MNKPAQNGDLLSFFQKHSAPGRIGLLHFDFPPARLIDFGQRDLTRDHKSAQWAHVCLFIESRDGEPWIAESDMNIKSRGSNKSADGPQICSVRKWIGGHLDHAAVLESGLTLEQARQAEKRAHELIAEGNKYGLLELAGTWMAIKKRDLTYHSALHREHTMHCSHFLRLILRAADCDPFGQSIAPENTTPEHIFQSFKMVAEWRKEKA